MLLTVIKAILFNPLNHHSSGNRALEESYPVPHDSCSHDRLLLLWEVEAIERVPSLVSAKPAASHMAQPTVSETKRATVFLTDGTSAAPHAGSIGSVRQRLLRRRVRGQKGRKEEFFRRTAWERGVNKDICTQPRGSRGIAGSCRTLRRFLIWGQGSTSTRRQIPSGRGL